MNSTPKISISKSSPSALPIGCVFAFLAAPWTLVAQPCTHLGVNFPGGVASFADAVERYDPTYFGGAIPTNPALANPELAIGVPTGSAADAVALGAGGYFVVQFTDNALSNTGTSAPDLQIFEVAPAEPYFVAVKPDIPTRMLLASGGATIDGAGFIALNTASGFAGINLDSFFPGHAPFTLRFVAVRLLDATPTAPAAPATGADIDAVGAIATLPADHQPNRPSASATWNAQDGTPFPITLAVAQGQIPSLRLDVRGAPNSGFILGRATAGLLGTGISTPLGLLDLNLAQGLVVLMDGLTFSTGSLFDWFANTGASGHGHITIPVPPSGAAPGALGGFQVLIADPTAPSGASLTAATSITITSGAPAQNRFYVSSVHGAPGNPGTVFAPLATLTAGLNAAASSGSPNPEVFVSIGTYNEAPVFTAGVTVHGGRDPWTWARRPFEWSKILLPPNTSANVLGSSAPIDATLTGVEIVAADATVASSVALRVTLGTSSFTLLVPELVATDCIFRAGRGAVGQSGAAPVAAIPTSNSCYDTFSGFPGGGGVNPFNDGGPGNPGSWAGPSCSISNLHGAGGAGGLWVNPPYGFPFPPPFTAAPGQNGSPGQAGPSGANGVPPASGGSLQSPNWIGASGSAGASGGPGGNGGGGGGGASTWSIPVVVFQPPPGSNGGSGGRCTHVGGGGGGGQGGGLSAAILFVAGSGSLNFCLLRADGGGAGGAGANGAPLRPGTAGDPGQPGMSENSFTGGSGGNGGAGGSGAAGGGGAGGAGGPTCGIFRVAATSVTTNSCAFITSPGGPGGLGGMNGNGLSQAPSGPAGAVSNIVVQ